MFNKEERPSQGDAWKRPEPPLSKRLYDSKPQYFTTPETFTANGFFCVVENFRLFAGEIDVLPGEIVSDGLLRRCGTLGKENGRDGWYLIRPDWSGVVGNHRTGEKRIFQPSRNSDKTPEERAEYRRRVEIERRKREAEQLLRYSEAASQAVRIWAAASPASADHLYLVRKQIEPYTLRESRGRLVIPIYDGAGQLRSLQFISTDGSKRFLSGGKITGGFFQIGGVTDPAGVIIVAEGFATVATLHEQTGYPIFAAFSAGNLERVALLIRARYPQVMIIIAADNDHETETKTGRNPGMEAAQKAAAACGGRLMIPPVLPGCTDWNDIIQYERGGLHERHPE